MKKLFVLLLFTMSYVVNLSAQESFSKVSQGKGEYSFIPKVFTNDNVVYMVVKNDRDKLMTVYDKDFKLVKSFIYDPGFFLINRRTEAREKKLSVENHFYRTGNEIDIYSRYIENYSDTVGVCTIEKMIEMWKKLFEANIVGLNPDDYIFKNDSINGIYGFYPKSDSQYYRFEEFGYDAPKMILQCNFYDINECNGILYMIENEPEFLERYTGNWVTIEAADTLWIREEKMDGDFVYNDVDNFGTLNNSVALTQTFFNDDEKFEYILPKYKIYELELQYEQDRDYDGEIDYRVYSMDYGWSGFNIYSEGELVASVEYPKYNDFYINDINFFKFGEKNYLGFVQYTDSDAGRIYTIYSFDKSTNAIEQVFESAPAKMSVNDDVVKIDFKESVKDKCELIITNVAGQFCGKIDIESGSESVRYNTRTLERGVYNFMVLQKGKMIENGKIFVR